MDQSFKTWRNSQRESSHSYVSDDDSDNIVCSNSAEDIVISASASDDSDDVSFQKDESQNSTISVKTEKKISSFSRIDTKTSVNSVSSSTNISSDKSNVQKRSSKSEGSSKNSSHNNSSVQRKSLKSDNISTDISSEDSSLGQSLLKENTSSSSLELQIKSRVKKNRIIDSDSSSDSIDEDFEHSLNQSPFHDENICSSTRLVNSDNTSLVKSNSKRYSKDNSFEEKKSNLTEKSLEGKNKIPTFDLTLGESNNAFDSKHKHKNLPTNISNVRSASNDKVIIIESDSEEDDKSKHKLNVQDEATNIQEDLTKHFSSIKISPDKQKTKLDMPTSSLPSNDLSSRIESLKAEEARLGMEVSGVVKNIDATKVITVLSIILPYTGCRKKKNTTFQLK